MADLNPSDDIMSVRLSMISLDEQNILLSKLGRLSIPGGGTVGLLVGAEETVAVGHTPRKTKRPTYLDCPAAWWAGRSAPLLLRGVRL